MDRVRRCSDLFEAVCGYLGSKGVDWKLPVNSGLQEERVSLPIEINDSLETLRDSLGLLRSDRADLISNTVELIPTRVASFPQGGPVQDPALAISGLEGYLAHKKYPPPQDRRMTLGIVLL